MSSLNHIRSYYEALNTGDVDAIASHFTDDAVHLRAYHHRDRRNPAGDLLGFDLSARGYTTLDSWQALER
jgi:ketosteroid isomerase-like protein